MLSVSCFILRNECMVDAQFVITYSGKALDGAVISRFSESEQDCRERCMKDDQCKSININNNRRKCELNNKIAGDNGTLFVTRDGWKYKTTNFSERQVNVLHDNYIETVPSTGFLDRLSWINPSFTKPFGSHTFYRGGGGGRGADGPPAISKPIVSMNLKLCKVLRTSLKILEMLKLFT